MSEQQPVPPTSRAQIRIASATRAAASERPTTTAPISTATEQPPPPVRGTAAGVPFLAVPPDTTVAGVPADPGRAAARSGVDGVDGVVGPAPSAPPVIVAWHLMDPPRSEAAFAAALPLRGLGAWRIYLGLPMHGERAPAGGTQEAMRLAFDDVVRNVHAPVARQGAAEFPAALAELGARFGFEVGPGGSPLALVGGSMGAAVAQLVLARTGPAAGLVACAAVLVSPLTQLAAAVEAGGRRHGVTYAWDAESRAVAAELDFPARAGQTAAAGAPAVRIVVGADDDAEGFVAPARRLHAALSERYDDPSRVDLAIIAGMGHALADEPGTEPAPQTPAAAHVDGLAVDWLRRYLPAGAGPARAVPDAGLARG